MKDAAVIGLGPAGMTAALYLNRAKMDIACFDKMSYGGQILLTDRIENYPGFPEGISGFELAQLFKKHLDAYSVDMVSDEVTKIKKSNGHFTVQTPSSAIDVVSVVVTSGAFPKRLGIKGEKEFTGKGVSYCATCDANFFKGKIVAVLGGGNSAVEEAIYLSKFAAKIYLIHRRDRLRAVGVLQDRIFSLSNLEFMFENIVEEIGGESRVEYISVKDVKSGIKKNISLDGVFIFAGYSPNSNFVQNFLQLDSGGYIITDGDFKTSQEGVFAAGDVRSSSLKQVVSACGEGAKAAVGCIKHIEKIKGVAYE